MNLYFLGGGNMANAIISGLYTNKLFNIFVVDKHEEKLNLLKKKYNINIIKTLPDINSQDILFLAIKPQNIKETCLNLNINNNPLIISIVAGITIKNIANWMSNDRIIRTMPNLPAQILQGVSGLYANDNVLQKDRDKANVIFKSIGKAIWVVNEESLDAFTCICGIGPGCIFYLMDKLLNEAYNLGFSRTIAKDLVLDTFQGSVAFAKQSGLDFKELQDKVTSKGGVTQVALTVFNELGIANILHKSIKASMIRTKQLSEYIE